MGRKRVGATTIVATMLATQCGAASAVQLDYLLNAGVERNDNLLLTETDPVSENILRAGIGFLLSEETSAVQTSITGSAEYRNYDAFPDAVDGTLTGRLNWNAVPERLSFTIEDNLALQSINTLAADSPGNRQQVNVLSLGPTLFFDLARGLKGQAELRYISSDAEVTDEFNSQRLGLALRTVKELSTTSRVSLNLQGQRVDFDNDIVARDYTRYDVFARYARNLARFEIGLDAGYSRLAYRDGNDTRSEPLLRADLGWSPSERHRLNLRASRQFSDAATDALAGVEDATATVPGTVLLGDAVVNASAYEERRLSLGYVFTNTRLTLTFEPYINRLDYVDSNEFDQDGHGAIFDLSVHLRPRLSLGMFATLENIAYSQLDIKQETRRYGVHVRRDWSRHWSGRIEWSRYERRSTVLGEDADQNLLYLSMTYYNR
ncbi:MAG: hypothetical protein LH470_00165 [Lysobacter sp.]|nr:hypothetical protein [Lysobacter sp.]